MNDNDQIFPGAGEPFADWDETRAVAQNVVDWDDNHIDDEEIADLCDGDRPLVQWDRAFIYIEQVSA